MNWSMQRTVEVLGLLCLGGWAWAQPPVSLAGDKPPVEAAPAATAAPREGAALEALHGIRRDPNDPGQLRVAVFSRGCTRADDFSLAVEGDALAIRRGSPDRCRRKPFSVELVLRLPDGVALGAALPIANSVVLPGLDLE